MNLCRICLSTSTERDIVELQATESGADKNYCEILSYCLDIQVTEDCKLTKLCNNCFNTIIYFYKFKTLALKSAIYLKTINFDCKVKLEVFVDDEIVTNNNDLDVADDDTLCDTLTGELSNAQEIKIENHSVDFQPDEEVISDLDKIKLEETIAAGDHIKELPTTVPVRKNNGPQKTTKGNKRPLKNKNIHCAKSVPKIQPKSLKDENKGSDKKFTCNYCDKTFTNNNALYKHNRRHMKTKCEICDKEVADMRAHILRIHNTDKLGYQCNVCQRRCISKAHLNVHLMQHTEERPHECDICHKKYKTSYELKYHKRRIHELEKSFLCQYCSKSFFTKHHMKRHIRSHTKEKPYKCEECGRSFGIFNQLTRHRKSHDTEKKFHCEHCNKKFVKLDYLRVHIRTHTKEKRYPCKYCGVLFGRSDHRKRHQHTAHEQFLPSNTK